MSREAIIIGVDRIGGNAVLIVFKDQSAALLTADQIMQLGILRLVLPPEDDSFAEAIRAAVRIGSVHK